MAKKTKKSESRESKILNYLVEEHIRCGNAISSKVISEKYLPKVSPATIRLELGKLEKKGYVSQPHTSAGRIPTLTGYRSYLKHIEEALLNTTYEQEELLRRILISYYKDTATTLHYVMQLLAKETDQLSFVAEPEIAYGYLEKLEVFKISQNKLLFVVSLDTGIDKTVIINCDYEITENQLKALVRYVNESLAGMRIYDIQHKHIEELTGKIDEVNLIFNRFLQEFEKALDEMSNFFIHFEAGISFLEQPKFDDKSSLLSFLGLTQRQDVLVSLMQDGLADKQSQSKDKRKSEKKYHILLGEDLGRQEWFDYALAYSKYELYGIPGFLGILAPVRMDYMKNIPVIHNIAKIITDSTRKGSVVVRNSRTNRRESVRQDD